MDADPGRLDPRRRIALARVSGLGQRLAFNPACADLDLADAVAQLHEISSDAELYGLALGAALADLEEWPQRSDALVVLYRAAGADEQVAAALAWQRERRERRRNSAGRPTL